MAKEILQLHGINTVDKENIKQGKWTPMDVELVSALTLDDDELQVHMDTLMQEYALTSGDFAYIARVGGFAYLQNFEEIIIRAYLKTYTLSPREPLSKEKMKQFLITHARKYYLNSLLEDSVFQQGLREYMDNTPNHALYEGCKRTELMDSYGQSAVERLLIKAYLEIKGTAVWEEKKGSNALVAFLAEEVKKKYS